VRLFPRAARLRLLPGEVVQDPLLDEGRRVSGGLREKRVHLVVRLVRPPRFTERRHQSNPKVGVSRRDGEGVPVFPDRVFVLAQREVEFPEFLVQVRDPPAEQVLPGAPPFCERISAARS